MAYAIQHAKFTGKALKRRRYRAAQSPARGMVFGLVVSTILWLTSFVIWLHYSL